MRTGSVIVSGDVTKIVAVSSSKLLMNASTQPPAKPGRIAGSVTRRKVVQRPAPSERAARSLSSACPTSAAMISRSAYGKMSSAWQATRLTNEPPMSSSVNSRRNAMPSTTGGIISGESRNELIASRPGKR